MKSKHLLGKEVHQHTELMDVGKGFYVMSEGDENFPFHLRRSIKFSSSTMKLTNQ